ncbi:hypothetical protein [Streptomyces sp. NPDC021562]|uniref:hypothetical protein n=1 Tax=Streptomyces sp. NPDC021562 TaxID=3155121 RepID=UPI0033F20377
MTTCRARRTARSAALLAVAAAAALSLTACQSGGKDAAGQTKNVSAATSGAGRAETTADEAQSGMRTQTTAARRTAAAAATPRTASPVRTQTLPDGSKAEIRRLGAQHYLLKLVHHGDVLATMEAKHRDAGLDANDMFLVLTKDGRVEAWMGGGHQGPGTFELMGGWTAKVTKAGEDHYRARILGDAGGVSGTMDANGRDAGVEIDRVYVVLSAGGVVSAHS